MNAHKRVEIEKQIVGQAVKDLLAAGFTLSIDGENSDRTVVTSPDSENLFAEDECTLVASGEKIVGWVFFVYGNNGWDVMSDYTVNLEPWLKDAGDLAGRLEAECG